MYWKMYQEHRSMDYDLEDALEETSEWSDKCAPFWSLTRNGLEFSFKKSKEVSAEEENTRLLRLGWEIEQELKYLGNNCTELKKEKAKLLAAKAQIQKLLSCLVFFFLALILFCWWWWWCYLLFLSSLYDFFFFNECKIYSIKTLFTSGASVFLCF